MLDYTLTLMAGSDIPIVECQITAHQPTIKEISILGEKEFFIGMQLLCTEKEDYIEDEEELQQVTNFSLFMTIMNDARNAESKEIVKQVLKMLFPQYHILWTPRSLLFNLNEQNNIIDENNFNALQTVLKAIGCIRGSDRDKFNPANAAAAEIAKKLERGRKRVAAQRQAENNSSVFSQYLSVLTVGIQSMSLQDLLELTVYQFYDLIERYTLFSNWDLVVRQRLAGAQVESQVDNWMKFIH